MTVKELREELTQLPDDMIVILQGDSEGNSFDELTGFSTNCIWDSPEQTVFDDRWTADEAGMSKADWKKLKAGPRVCVLSP